MDLESIFKRFMDSKMKITLVDQCYSERAVVINVGRDSVTVCDTPELMYFELELHRMAHKNSRDRRRAFVRGDINGVRKHGDFAQHLHGCITRLSDDLSIRTIKFDELIGFTV